MKRILLLVIALVCFSVSTFAQDAKPPKAEAPVLATTSPVTSDIPLTDVERLQVQAQLLLQENAALRKELAQTKKTLADANLALAEANEQQVKNGGAPLIQQFLDNHKVDASKYEFKMEPGDDTKPTVMKLAPKAVPAQAKP